jgi:tetratricopeptide (TPR) repeat protein
MGMFAEAEADLTRALALTRQNGTPRDISRTLGSMALALEMSGRLEEGRKITLEVLEMARRDGDERIVWVGLTNLAEAEFALGEIQSAAHHLEELLASKMARKNVRLRGNTRSNLAAYYIALHRIPAARALARSAVLDARQAGDYGIMSCALGHLAATLAEHDPTGAARLLGYVESVFASGYRRENTERYTHSLLMATLHRTLTDDQIADLVRHGASMTEDQAVRYALSHRRVALE